MAIPDYQQAMLPLMQFASDEQHHRTVEAYDHIARVFDVSEAER